MTSRFTSKADVVYLFNSQGGVCFSCPAKLDLGPDGERRNFIVEHEHALGRGGSNRLANKSLRCLACAKEKTFHPRSRATTLGSDLFEIAKAKRIARGGKRRKGQKIKSRGFNKTLSRRFDGSVTQRKK